MSELANQIEFQINPEPRCPCLLLLDISGSMAGKPISELTAGLSQFQSETVQDSLACRRTEVAILTFSDQVELLQDFVTVDKFMPPVLTAGGTTSLASAILEGIRLLNERKGIYRQNGISYYRPWLMLITDGSPTDEPAVITQAQKELESAQSANQLSFFAIGVEGADMNFLSELGGAGRAPLRLRGLQFREFFRWLSSSMSRVSASRVGDKVPLAPVGWSEA